LRTGHVLHRPWIALAAIAVGRSGGGAPRRVLWIWRGWEELAHALWPLQSIPGSAHDFVRVRFHTYRGPVFQLDDGQVIHTGDRVGEIHFNSRVLAGYQSRRGSEKWKIATVFADDLRAMATWMESLGSARRVVAFHGLTVLGRATKRFGFTRTQLRGRLRRRSERLFLTGLVILYSAEGFERLTDPKFQLEDAQEVWISVSEVLRRYSS
jgi:hypothetical protein